jgi:hypothetical protein
MTVRATNIAFLDLEKYSTPRFVHRKDDDVVLLESRIAMVEVQNDDVALAAVNAWMGPEICADQSAVLLAVAANPRNFLPDIGVPVSQVMLTSVLCVTSTASPLSRPFRLVLEGERLNRFESSAAVAPLCRGLSRWNRTDERHEGPLRSGSALRSA